MGSTTRSCYLHVGVVSVVLLIVFLLPGCQSSPIVDPKATQSPTFDPKTKQSSTIDPETRREVDELVEKLINGDENVRSSAAFALGSMCLSVRSSLNHSMVMWAVIP